MDPPDIFRVVSSPVPRGSVRGADKRDADGRSAESPMLVRRISERFSLEPRTCQSIARTVCATGRVRTKSVVPGLETAMSNLEANRLELRGDLSELRRLAECD